MFAAAPFDRRLGAHKRIALAEQPADQAEQSPAGRAAE
jgi:hypothetical protein